MRKRKYNKPLIKSETTTYIYHLLGYSPTTIAKKEGIALPTVYDRINRCQDKLKIDQQMISGIKSVYDIVDKSVKRIIDILDLPLNDKNIAVIANTAGKNLDRFLGLLRFQKEVTDSQEKPNQDESNQFTYSRDDLIRELIESNRRMHDYLTSDAGRIDADYTILDDSLGDNKPLLGPCLDDNKSNKPASRRGRPPKTANKKKSLLPAKPDGGDRPSEAERKDVTSPKKSI